MDIFVPKFIKYQLYLLQLENYELARYWRLLKSKGFFPSKNQAQRKELIWTAKAKALMLMAAALHLLLAVIIGLIVLAAWPGLDNLFSALILSVLVLLPFYFVLFSVALAILAPLDGYVKNQLVKKAQAKLLGLTDLKIIGIAGSYGKTTMKEVLGQVLGIRYKVLGTPESVNTPVGIARFIINKVSSQTQVLILELGEHYKGDIKQLCEIARPDITVITGINEAHLERMGSLDNTLGTIFEAVEFAKDSALVVINADNEKVAKNYGKFIKPGNRVIKFQVSSFKLKQFDPERLLWTFEDEDLGKVEVGLLGEYALGNAAAAIIVARQLGLNSQEIKIGLSQVRPVEHRLQPIKSGDVLVIDDSYNGNPDGVKEAIKVLARFTNHRKIFITPGLVETGSASEEIHRKIGRELVGVADIVILIKNSVTGFIAEGVNTTPSPLSGATPPMQGGELGPISSFSKEEYPTKSGEVVQKTQIIWFNSAQEAHEGLKNIIKSGDVALFQNDWGDQYV